MQLILFIALLIFLLGLAISVAVYTIENFWRAIITQDAPFVPVPKKIIPHIVRALRLNKGDVMYDLGCGDARILTACYTDQPYASYKGMDVAFVPRVLAWLRLRKIKGRHSISIYKSNFFERDISDATHIFVFLLPSVMDNLLQKFQKECKPGTRVVSCDFPFKKKEPLEIIDLHRSARVLGRYLYIYEF